MRRKQRPCTDVPHCVGEGASVFRPRACKEGSGIRVDDIATGVDGRERADDESVGKDNRRRAESALHGAASTEKLANGRACSRADVALANRIAGGLLGGVVSGLRVGTNRRVAKA